MDLSLLVTLAVIFVATLIGSALRASSKDRCLEDMSGYHVTIERKDGRIVWGEMRLFSSGAEIEYREDVRDEQHHTETSYVLYKNELTEAQAIYRYADDLTEENQRRRDASVRRAFHPNFARRFVRALRNFLNTAANSLTEALNLLLGRSKIVTDQLVLTQGQNEIKGLTKSILGYVGTSYDDLLESFIGAQLVVETSDAEATYEYLGVLKDYTATYLQILDVVVPQELELSLQRNTPSELIRRGGLCIEQRGPVVTLRNRTRFPIVLVSVTWGEAVHSLNEVVDAGASLEYVLPAEAQQATIACRLVRQLDMLLPRAHALIRHRAERYEPVDAIKRPMAMVLSGLGDSRFPRPERSARERIKDAESIEQQLLSEVSVTGAAQRLTEMLEQRQEAQEEVREANTKADTD